MLWLSTLLLLLLSSTLAQTETCENNGVMTLFGKTAVVTGGSGTIGQAIAKALLSKGASVVLTGRRLEKLEQAKATLLQLFPNEKVVVLPSDVSKEESVEEMFKTLDSEHGGIDLLVNNAGSSLFPSLKFKNPILLTFLLAHCDYSKRNYGPRCHYRAQSCRV